MASSPLESPDAVSAERLARLYHGGLEEFTAERNALAKELRADGEKDAAAWVKGLKKPSRAASIVNQLAERKPDAVRELVEAGQELRRSQEEMLAGGGRDALRDAARREKDAVAKLVDAAAEQGAGSQILDRVAETLQAVALDPGVAEQVEAGLLTREQRATSVGGSGIATEARPPKRTKRDAAAERREQQRAERERKQAETAVAKAEKRAERAREQLVAGENELRDAEAELTAARKAAQRATG